MLKEQAEALSENKEKLLSDNAKLEKQQKKLQREIEKMVQSKEVMERNIHAYDEDEKWQLPEPGALTSAKNYKDKKALTLVERLKEVIKALTICPAYGASEETDNESCRTARTDQPLNG